VKAQNNPHTYYISRCTW